MTSYWDSDLASRCKWAYETLLGQGIDEGEIGVEQLRALQLDPFNSDSPVWQRSGYLEMTSQTLQKLKESCPCMEEIEFQEYCRRFVIAQIEKMETTAEDQRRVREEMKAEQHGTDELVLAFGQVAEKVYEVIQQTLVSLDEDNLLVQLGMRQEIVQRNLLRAGEFSLEVSPPKEPTEHQRLHTFGRRLWSRYKKSCYDLVCDDSQENSEDRKKLASVLPYGPAFIASGFTIVFVKYGAMAPIIATVLGTLFERAIREARKVACEEWKAALWPADDNRRMPKD